MYSRYCFLTKLKLEKPQNSRRRVLTYPLGKHILKSVIRFKGNTKVRYNMAPVVRPWLEFFLSKLLGSTLLQRCLNVGQSDFELLILWRKRRRNSSGSNLHVVRLIGRFGPICERTKIGSISKICGSTTDFLNQADCHVPHAKPTGKEIGDDQIVTYKFAHEIESTNHVNKSVRDN